MAAAAESLGPVTQVPANKGPVKKKVPVHEVPKTNVQRMKEKITVNEVALN